MLFSTKELVKILQVTPRTVFRDLAAVRLATDYPLKLTGTTQTPLSTAEIIALALAAKLSPLQTISAFAGPLNASLAKLVLNSSEEVRSGLTQLLNGCSFTTEPTLGPETVLETILKAIRHSQAMRVEYHNEATNQVEQIKLRQCRLEASLHGWCVRGTRHRKSIEIKLHTITVVEPLLTTSHK